jgi:hypothetical protein
MSDVLDELRAACARVPTLARHVSIVEEAIEPYAASLPLTTHPAADPDPGAQQLPGGREQLAAFWLTLDAINFGSGWFPTLRKRERRSGYFTIALGVREQFASIGPWTASQLAQVEAAQVAAALRQDPEHELMALFACSLRDLGTRVGEAFDGRFSALVDAAGRSAVELTTMLGRWRSFADRSTYMGFEVPFLKRAQIAAADLERAGVAAFDDLQHLTMFADNLVPHVLRLDGVLRLEPELVARIDRGELIAHGSPEEVEIRACAVHAVELIAAQRPGACAAEIDHALWTRGGEPFYKASPRHRSRCTAY